MDVCLGKKFLNFLGMPAKEQPVQEGVPKLGGARDADARDAHRSNGLEVSETGGQ